MDYLVSKERELEVDLESGGTTSEEDRTDDPNLANRTRKNFRNRIWGGIFLSFDGPVKVESSIDSCSSSSNFVEAADENVELLIDKSSEGEGIPEFVAVAQEKSAEGKRKKTNSRKPPKPPRPPIGPSLDAADQKLVREMAELAMRKRARIERIKALKKMRAVKASSSSSSLSALVVTILFCLIITFQGISSRNNASAGLQGPPAPAVATNEGLITVQFYKNFSAYEENGLGSTSFNLAKERTSGTGSEEGASEKL
ncbi:hypothetical protein CFOL_v3_27121 [Cephalotus follicularis]|uniref:Transmembrane protein n=1 Tax=Cephalotus follicularis TaxID=3775 RepID=A0A1Q3CU15_CEPFO|nr:hypothetical protein CFOL_v3_27121 [Cephalotus follicularis]